MKCLEHSLEYKTTKNKNEAYPVIIVAAGTASRMKGIDKLSTELCGIPVIARTVCTFDKCDSISEIVIVTRKEKNYLRKKYAKQK